MSAVRGRRGAGPDAGPRIAGRGTPEAPWLALLTDRPPPPLPLDVLPDEVVVVAPHPDDEVLGVGGLLARLAARGVTIRVVAVTDGEASNPGGSVAPADLARLRVAETGRALAALGVTGPPVRLGLPDGAAGALEGPVREAVTCAPGTWLLAPWAGDGHPDHEAVGRACAAVADRDGAVLLAFPVWAWHWDDPGAPALPWDRAAAVVLTSQECTAKQRAVDAFVTQVAPLGPLPQDAPVLPSHVLARFSRGVEVVLR